VAGPGGVQRPSVYAHFPDGPAIFRAGTAHWLHLNPLPDHERWTAIASFDDRVETAIRDVHAWWERTADDLIPVMADMGRVAAMAEAIDFWRERTGDWVAAVLAGHGLRGRRRARTEAALRHALALETWRSLTAPDGMTPSEAVRLLSGFVRQAAAKGEGTGLGLATVYGIVTQTGGTIEIDSTPGEGTTIEVMLPATEAQLPEEPEASGGPDSATLGETILVVEDEAAVRRLTCRILKREGYTVLEAPDGRHAIDTWDAHPGEIDLLLTDVVMPGMSGKELAERLGIEPVFMSGYTDDVILRHGMEGLRLVQKPFDARTLLGAVRSALDA
jgi:CheY-like chemotaxis protein